MAKAAEGMVAPAKLQKTKRRKINIFDSSALIVMLLVIKLPNVPKSFAKQDEMRTGIESRSN